MVVKMQRTNPVTYLLEDYRGKSVVGAFYEHELHRATHPDVYLVEKALPALVAQEERQVHQVAGIRWIA